MSYSDYGGFAWKIVDRKWERFQAAEDGTLVGVEAPSERPLEAATGFKLDVLLNAYQKQGLDYTKDAPEESPDDWITKHPHHCVLGGMKGVGLVGHKGSVTVTVDGKKVKSFPDYDDYKSDPYEKGDEEKVNLGDWKYALKASQFKSAYSMLLLSKPDGTAYAGVSGYGIGEHWWQDEEGYEHIRPGDRISLFPKTFLIRRNRPTRSSSHTIKIFRRKQRKYQCFGEISPVGITPEEYKKLEQRFLVDWVGCSVCADADKKQYGEDADLGRKPMDPWPGLDVWLKKLKEWASPILLEWKGDPACLTPT